MAKIHWAMINLAVDSENFSFSHKISDKSPLGQ